MSIIAKLKVSLIGVILHLSTASSQYTIYCYGITMYASNEQRSNFSSYISLAGTEFLLKQVLKQLKGQQIL